MREIGGYEYIKKAGFIKFVVLHKEGGKYEVVLHKEGGKYEVVLHIMLISYNSW